MIILCKVISNHDKVSNIMKKYGTLMNDKSFINGINVVLLSITIICVKLIDIMLINVTGNSIAFRNITFSNVTFINNIHCSITHSKQCYNRLLLH